MAGDVREDYRETFNRMVGLTNDALEVKVEDLK